MEHSTFEFYHYGRLFYSTESGADCVNIERLLSAAGATFSVRTADGEFTFYVDGVRRRTDDNRFVVTKAIFPEACDGYELYDRQVKLI